MMKPGPETLLLVDDHPAFRAVAKELLGPGRVIMEAASGEEAVLQYRTAATDWVVMDLRMPGIGGIEATRRILQHDPGARIVVHSQFEEPEYGELAREAGALAFFSKEDLAALDDFLRAYPPPPNPKHSQPK